MRALGALFLSFVFLSSLYFVSSKFVSGVSVEPQVLASTSELSQVQRQFLTKINSLRNQAGTSELAYNRNLEKLTDFRVDDMSNREYYSHMNPDGVTYSAYLDEYDIETDYSCENLQLQIGPDLYEAIKAWEDSASHYECLVNPRLNYIAFSEQLYMQKTSDNSQITTYVFAMIATD